MLIHTLHIIHDHTPHHAAHNMAIDELLLLTAPTTPILRLYHWLKPAVTFGYFTPHTTAHPIAAGRELIRRMTGGGIVEHGQDLTYTLILPPTHPLATSPARHTYTQIHLAIARWLHHRGITATLAPTPPPGPAHICFQSPAEADLLAGAQKIAGAAQRRTRHGLLHQGSILHPRLTEADRQDFPAALTAHPIPIPLSPDIQQKAHTLAAEKYARREWTQRV